MIDAYLQVRSNKLKANGYIALVIFPEPQLL